MNVPVETGEWYRGRFRSFEEGLNGASGSPLHALRRSGIAAFASSGFPTTDQEEWRFTNVAPIASTKFTPVLAYDPSGVTENDLRGLVLAREGRILLVFINGHFSRVLSSVPALPAGVTAGSLADALDGDPALALRFLAPDAAGEDAFGSLNTAFLVDGAFVRVGAGVALDEPVQILSISASSGAPLLVQPRHLIVAGEGARVAVVESYAGKGSPACLTNAVTQIVVGEGGSLNMTSCRLKTRTPTTWGRRVSRSGGTPRSRQTR